MRIILLFLLAARCVPISHAEDIAGKNTRDLPVMTWFHPLLVPSLADMTLLCTVVSVSDQMEIHESPRWKVRLRIDEQIHVHPRYVKRLDGVEFLNSSDSQIRKSGDRILVFAGLREPYEGDDFLLPSWSGTHTDLGIYLSADGDAKQSNETLLASLRSQAGNPKSMTADDYEAFAAFCPAGVAQHFIKQLRMKEFRESGEIGSPGKTEADGSAARPPVTASERDTESHKKPEPGSVERLGESAD